MIASSCNEDASDFCKKSDWFNPCFSVILDVGNVTWHGFFRVTFWQCWNYFITKWSVNNYFLMFWKMQEIHFFSKKVSIIFGLKNLTLQNQRLKWKFWGEKQGQFLDVFFHVFSKSSKIVFSVIEKWSREFVNYFIFGVFFYKKCNFKMRFSGWFSKGSLSYGRIQFFSRGLK